MDDPFNFKIKRTYNNYVNNRVDNTNLPNYAQIKSTLYNIRSRAIHKEPVSIETIPSESDFYLLDIDSDESVVKYSDNEMCIVSANFLMEQLVYEGEDVFLDCTFGISTDLFYQLYTVRFYSLMNYNSYTGKMNLLVSILCLFKTENRENLF